MPTNFLQFNSPQNNQESDGTYSTDVTRTAGIVLDQLLSSPLLNKMFYQWSTMVTALAQALTNKGYTVSDANISVLEAVVANILTNADMPLPVAKGGTGLTSASLVAGTGISITGSWPDQTVASSVGDPVTVGHGGTGASTLRGANIVTIVGSSSTTGSGAISPTNIVASVPAVGVYRVSFHAFSAAGSVGSGLTVEVIWTENGVQHTVNNFIGAVSTDTQTSSGTVDIYPDFGTAIQFAQTQNFVSTYNLYMRVELL